MLVWGFGYLLSDWYLASYEYLLRIFQFCEILPIIDTLAFDIVDTIGNLRFQNSIMIRVTSLPCILGIKYALSLPWQYTQYARNFYWGRGQGWWGGGVTVKEVWSGMVGDGGSSRNLKATQKGVGKAEIVRRGGGITAPPPKNSNRTTDIKNPFCEFDNILQQIFLSKFNENPMLLSGLT